MNVGLYKFSRYLIEKRALVCVYECVCRGCRKEKIQLVWKEDDLLHRVRDCVCELIVRVS